MAISPWQVTPSRHFWRALAVSWAAIVGTAVLVPILPARAAEEPLPMLPMAAADPAVVRTLASGPFRSAGNIEWARLLPDGKTILAAHLDLPRTSVFDVETGKLQSQIPLMHQAADLSADGHLIAGFRENYVPPKLDRPFGVWRWPDRTALWTSNTPGIKFYSRFSPDGRTLALFERLPGLGTPYVVRVVESATGRELWRQEIPAKREVWGTGLEWLRDDWVVVSLSSGSGDDRKGEVRIFRADAGTPVEFNGDATQNILGLKSGRPRQSLLVATEGYEFRVLRRTDADRLESVLADSPTSLLQPFQSLEVSPDGRWLLAVAHSYGRVYDLASGQIVRTLPFGFSSASFSADGKTVIGTHEFTMTLLSTETWEPLRPVAPLAHGSSITRLAFSPDGAVLASLDSDTVVLWDWRSGRARGRIPVKDEDHGWDDMVFHPKHPVLATGYGTEVFWWDFGALPEHPGGNVADAPVPRSARMMHMNDAEQSIHAHCLSFSGDGQRLLNTANQWANMLDLKADPRESGLRVRQLSVGPSEHYQHIRAAKVRPDAQRVSIVVGARVCTYELEPERLVGDWRLSSPEAPGAFSPDGRWYANHAENGDAAIYDVESGAVEISYPLGSTHPGLFGRRAGGPKAWSADGTRLAGVASNQLEAWTGLYVWDVKTGRSHGPHPIGTRAITALAFAPDGRHLALAASDGSIDIWDLEKLGW